MRAFLIILTLTFSALSSVCQTSHELFLGNVTCRSKTQYLDSTQRTYDIHYVNRVIGQSRFPIDISLTIRSFPLFSEVSARLYLDSVFKLYYISYGPLMNDKGEFTKVDTTYPPPEISLDSLFSKLVGEGIFSLPMISTDKLKRSWKAFYITKEGTMKERSININDGSEYILTFKVDKCYGQYIFDNPESYLEFYVDNPIFKRQDQIVKILMAAKK